MAKRKALGRGLGAYFPDMEETDEKKTGESSGGGKSLYRKR